jgi:hypothetical protein
LGLLDGKEDQLAVTADSGFPAQRPHVGMGRSDRDFEGIGDFFGCLAFYEEAPDMAFTPGESHLGGVGAPGDPSILLISEYFNRKYYKSPFPESK